MGLARERITLNPYEEDPTNMPLELGGDRWGHGIFIQPKGSSWSPPASETPQVAQSVDTEGGTIAANVIGLRSSPVLKIQVVEPADPASTNYITNPQIMSASGPSTTGYVQNAATGAFVATLVRDLVGYDYALFQQNPGTNTHEGITVGLTVPAVGTYTAGVWLKGAVGGEQVSLFLGENSGGVAGTNITLTTSWAWYTVTYTSTTNTAMYVDVYAQSTVALSFYATGFGVVAGTAYAESFDGTFPGCSWRGQPHQSPSTRPPAGGLRLLAIMADVERAVTNISRYKTGTIRRTFPNRAGTNTRVTYDLVNAQLAWDDTSEMNAGVAQGTITCVAEPYGRGPEVTTFTDAFAVLQSPLYSVDAGSLANFSGSGTGLVPSSATVGQANRALYTGSEYPFYVGEVSGTFVCDSTGTNFVGGVILKRTATNTYLVAYVKDTGTASVLNLDKVVNGTITNVLTSTLATRVTTTSGTYVLRCRIQRQNSADLVYLEYFLNPALPLAQTTSPTLTLGPYTVTDGVFAGTVPSTVGWTWTPSATSDRISSFAVAPYLARERALPVLRYGVPGVPGSAPGLGRMIVTDDSGNNQSMVRWGVGHDTVAHLGAGTDLFYEAESLTLAATTSSIAKTGASNGHIALSSVSTVPTVLVSGTFNHIGDYEVWVRANGTYTSQGPYAQLRWSLGDTQSWTLNTAAVMPAQAGTNNFFLLTLGAVHIPSTVTKWQAQFITWTLGLDFVWFVPITDGGALVTATTPTLQTPLAPTEYDTLQESSTTALSGSALTVGGSWTTAGSTAGDFTHTTSGYTSRTAGDTFTNNSLSGNGRVAYISTFSTSAGVTASIDLTAPTGFVSGGTTEVINGLLISYVSSTSLAVVVLQNQNAGTGLSGATLSYYSYTSGSLTLQGFQVAPNVSIPNGGYYTIQASRDTNGRVVAYVGAQNGTMYGPFIVVDPALATGGALVAGSVGIYDYWTVNGGLRQYQNFWAQPFSTDAIIYSGSTLTIYSNQAQRPDANGNVNSPASYVGQYLKLPARQHDDSLAVMSVKGSRTLPGYPDPGIDAIEAQVNITPRYAQVADL